MAITTKIIHRIALIGLLLIGHSELHAANIALEAKTRELQMLQNRIRDLNQNVTTARDKKETLSHELQHTDVSINNHSIRLQKTRHLLTNEEQQLRRLRLSALQQQESLQNHLQLLSEQVRSTYQLGQQDYIQLILNEQDPTRMSRLLTYYGYLSRARHQIILDLRQKLIALKQNQESIQEHTEKLNELIATEQHQLQMLSLAKNYQHQVITRLSDEIITSVSRITELQRNKTSLETLIKNLRSTPQAFMQQFKPFAQMLHRLAMPTAGQIATHFGELISEGQMRSNGLFIRANEDQAVAAIYPGRVIFANWMRGFGLMIIVDHGQGYLSLYAHNNTLYHKVGDVVRGGELIAKVGHSGGQNSDGVYVEIRHDGKPINPEQWITPQKSGVMGARAATF